MVTHNRTTQEFDDFFLDFYTKNSNEELETIFCELLKNDVLSQWSNLLNDCIAVYRQGYFLVTIPCLITIIEGVLSKIWHEPTNTKMIMVCREKYENSKDGSVTKVAWLSILEFIKCLYQDAKFNEARPTVINRHWVLHGRDSVSWRSVDSIRLFHALYALSGKCSRLLR